VRDFLHNLLSSGRESERLEGEEKLRSFFESISQGIIAVSATGKIVMANRRTEEMFGYSRSELLGESLDLLLPDRFRSSHRHLVGQYFATPRLRPIGQGLELTGLRKDSSEFPIEIGLSYFEGEHERLALGLISDISERKRISDELRRANLELHSQEAQLRSFLEAASQGIVAISAEGRIVLVNRRIEEMFGYSRQELIGESIELLLPERYRSRHAMYRTGYFAEPRLRPMGDGMDLAGCRKDGSEFPVEIGLSFIETGSGTLAMGLVSDITERKRTADRLAEAADDLRRSNAELEQFAYLASHDLQEPLRMVTGYLNILERRYAAQLDDDAREFIRFAVDGAVRMKGMIREILALSRVGTQAVQKVHGPAERMVQTAIDNLSAAIAESRAEIETAPLPSISADPALLVLVFQNLIGNAIKFHGPQPPRVSISACRRGPDWIFAVRDNGLGIKPEHVERIFRIFERLNPAEDYPGHGMGLAITKKIIERHGGRIWLESLPGEGSTFFFSIPN
jgi:PAS domain S-box-containing protein